MKKILIGMLVAFIVTVVLCGGTYLIDAFYYWRFSPMSNEFRGVFLMWACVGIAAGVIVRFDDKKRKR